jgi:DNA polymerase phi
VTAVASDGDFWISKVLSRIEELEGDKKHLSLVVDIDEDDCALFTRARETIITLRNRKGDQQESAKGAELLLLGTVLQHYCAGDDEDSMDSGALEVRNLFCLYGPSLMFGLQTCIDATSRMFLSDGKKKKEKKANDTTNEEAADEPVDVLVDTVIGFLEKSTAYMRTVGNQVFSLLAGSVKETTIDLIVTVRILVWKNSQTNLIFPFQQLERRDPSQLLEDEDEDMEDNDDGEEDEENSAESNSDEESEESEGGDSDDDINDEEADLELRKKIEEALRVNGIEPATGDTDSEEEELMDDDQMMAIDEQLAQVFRSRANEKKSGRSE